VWVQGLQRAELLDISEHEGGLLANVGLRSDTEDLARLTASAGAGVERLCWRRKSRRRRCSGKRVRMSSACCAKASCGVRICCPARRV
jgi:hypothetical protein